MQEGGQDVRPLRQDGDVINVSPREAEKGKLIPLSERFDTTKSDIRWMPDVQLQPDAAMPGAYNTTGGYRILPGKTAGRQRVYSSTGSLVGVAQSLEEARRMIEKKLKLN